MLIPVHKRGRIVVGHALVDDADFELVKGYHWTMHIHGGAQASTYPGEKQEIVLMHRLVMGAAKGDSVIHINKNNLDNRKANLRITDRSGVMAVAPHQYNKHGFRGVCQHRNKFRADIIYKKKKIRGTTRATAEEAARDYDALLRKFFGKDANFNFPEEQA